MYNKKKFLDLFPTASVQAPKRKSLCLVSVRFLSNSQHYAQSSFTHSILTGSAMQYEIAKLEEMYTVFNTPVVELFIEDYPHLFPILTDAYEHIVKIFGKSLQRAELRHETEPDEKNEANDLEYLSVLIKTNLSPKEAHKLQDRFDDEWWLDVEEDLIVISVEVPEPAL
jgi:hypothetical protein